MGHVSILLDEMGLDKMGLDEMGINQYFTPYIMKVITKLQNLHLTKDLDTV